MAESEATQKLIMQATIQAATAVLMALKEAATGPDSGASTTNEREVHKPRHVRPALGQPSFNQNAPD